MRRRAWLSRRFTHPSPNRSIWRAELLAEAVGVTVRGRGRLGSRQMNIFGMKATKRITCLMGLAAVWVGALPPGELRAEEKALKFDEVFQIIRTNLPGVTEEQLGAVAARGLIKELGGKVELRDGAPAAVDSGAAVAKHSIFPGGFGYVRIGVVDGALPGEFAKAVLGMEKPKGLVVDLRFAGGRDYDAAGKVADLFLAGGVTVLELEGRAVQSTDESPALRWPLAVLVNAQTAGAAEALAAILQRRAAALLLGGRTAGEAKLFETVALSTGQSLRIARIPIGLGDGAAIPEQGLVPDIEVAIGAAEERAFLDDPHGGLAGALTSAPRQRAGLAGASGELGVGGNGGAPAPFNEAELVRRHRAGQGGSLGERPSAGEPAPRPVVADPVLARGLDFLKGVAVLQQQSRPN